MEVSLCWPPVPEGILVEREDFREYFVWARNQSEAKARLAGLRKEKAPAACQEKSKEVM